MGILLTDEEIDAIDCTYERCGDTKHNTDAHKLAQAQLKKVVGWLRGNGMCLCSCDKDDDGLTYRIPFKTQQALLKEVGDGN